VQGFDKLSTPMDTTPATLLERLRQEPDEKSWSRLVQLYTPLLFFWARRSGETEHDAADLVQDVFVALVQALPTFAYDPSSGKFRNWLRTLLLNKLRDRHRRDARRSEANARHVREGELPDGAEAFWEAEYQKELARRALQLMQEDFAPNTWKACWETVVQGRPADEVARELGISENAVYIARCRVLRRLRQELSGLLD
jgi:RNA polymerase sigma-70 factor, ECF subfamily